MINYNNDIKVNISKRGSIEPKTTKYISSFGHITDKELIRSMNMQTFKSNLLIHLSEHLNKGDTEENIHMCEVIQSLDETLIDALFRYRDYDQEIISKLSTWIWVNCRLVNIPITVETILKFIEQEVYAIRVL